mgnify:CR=1 FL=1
MDIRQLRYLVALAQEKHFTRAAELSGVTQPTLSSRISQLEADLGVPIVSRGQRFHGFTPEGEIVLKWARSILEQCDALHQELDARKGALQGHLKLGVIPSALPGVARLTERVHRAFPGVTFAVLSRSSIEILDEIATYELDAGITYLDGEPIDRMISKPLYEETYLAITRDDHPFAGQDAVTWADAGAEPICLLTPNMQFRRIVDAAFAEAGSAPKPVIETNSIVNLIATVRAHRVVGVVPRGFRDEFGSVGGVAFRPLTAPEVHHVVGLVALDRTPLPPLTEALFDIAAIDA